MEGDTLFEITAVIRGGGLSQQGRKLLQVGECSHHKICKLHKGQSERAAFFLTGVQKSGEKWVRRTVLSIWGDLTCEQDIHSGGESLLSQGNSISDPKTG